MNTKSVIVIGAGIAGASVAVDQINGQPGWAVDAWLRPPGAPRSISDAEGSYEVDGLTPEQRESGSGLARLAAYRDILPAGHAGRN